MNINLKVCAREEEKGRERERERRNKRGNYTSASAKPPSSAGTAATTMCTAACRVGVVVIGAFLHLYLCIRQQPHVKLDRAIDSLDK